MNPRQVPPQGQPPPPAFSYSTPYQDPPPEEPPPSYEDATHSSSSPLLVGPPPDYGTYRAYADSEHDGSSIASSEVESSSRSLPEWVGQALVVLCFLGIIYGFWKLVNDPDFDGFPG